MAKTSTADSSRSLKRKRSSLKQPPETPTSPSKRSKIPLKTSLDSFSPQSSLQEIFNSGQNLAPLDPVKASKILLERFGIHTSYVDLLPKEGVNWKVGFEKPEKIEWRFDENTKEWTGLVVISNVRR
jgi:hypothetical protein